MDFNIINKYPKLTKEKANGYDYFTLQEIKDKIFPVLAENGYSVEQKVNVIDQTVSVTSTLYFDVDTEEDSMVIKAPIVQLPSLNYYQSIGAAITYLKRISLIHLLDIPDNADKLMEKDDTKAVPENKAKEGFKRKEVLVGDRNYDKIKKLLSEGSKIEDIEKLYILSPELIKTLIK